ncbi:MAG TPA: right-handed parallel beta-helix repeat-containing protein, partial [Blastocatellia bacterium]|nr:right-handed parallel beta-helix repeat-containing protein [Blastocatellia bacterium]
ASPLYRVQVQNIPNPPGGVDGTRRKIRFLTLPRDQQAQPLAGQAVEIIPWGALLPNQEKVAEFQGQFFTVETSFDPEDGSLTITEPVAPEAIQWLADHSQFWSDLDEPEHQQYFYLRLWTGGSGDAADPDLQFTPGTPVALKGTGLNAEFSDEGLPGDFWIIAARPSTPNLVVPWDLLDSAPPAGPRYFFAPLALVQWRLDQTGNLQSTVHDCRERFRPLCDIRGCCTVTVGDGVSSRGDFDSIEEAIAHLPDPGGEVCLLPGLHETNAILQGRRNVVIKGCGNQTVVIPRRGNRQAPIFRVVDSQRITLRDMVLFTLTGQAIVLEGSKPGALKEVDISYNRILAFKQAVQVRRGVDIRIHENRIRILDKEGGEVAIQILAEDAVIERNDLGVVPAAETHPPDPPDGSTDPTTPCADPEVIFLNPAILSALTDHIFGLFLQVLPVAPFKALGGIQIVAASERVKVLDNNIAGGAGNGITLGGDLPEQVILAQQEPSAQQVIESTGNNIQGTVLQDGVGAAGIGLVFTRDDGLALNAVSGSGGFFNVPAEQNRFRVAVSSPGRAIENVAVNDDIEFGRFHRITINAQAAAPNDVLAFLYEIQIDRNEISNMGLSGIGYPIVAAIILAGSTGLTTNVPSQVAAALLALLGNPVATLGIHRNNIHDCLQNPFDGQLRAEATRRGFGGISLGFSEDVTISGNRIERNGTSHINPVCGIFIRFSEKAEIHHNHILDNGPLTASTAKVLETGLRGGVVLFAASFGIDELFLGRDAAFDTGRHAARLHDNIVHQPAGQALRLFAIGPSSICDNLFSTELSGPQTLERLGGTVLLLAVGGTTRLPAGLILFNSNQSQIGAGAISLTSQLILSTDDIGFDGNQSVALTDGLVLTDTLSLFANTLLISRTLRATDSRFKESPGSRAQALKFSLMTLTNLLNNTNNNQGDHCILAVNTAPGRPANIAGNQVVDSTLCQRFSNSVTAPLSAFPVNATIIGG